MPPCLVIIEFSRHINEDLMGSFLSNFTFLPICNKVYLCEKDVE